MFQIQLCVLCSEIWAQFLAVKKSLHLNFDVCWGLPVLRSEIWVGFSTNSCASWIKSASQQKETKPATHLFVVVQMLRHAGDVRGELMQALPARNLLRTTFIVQLSNKKLLADVVQRSRWPPGLRHGCERQKQGRQTDQTTRRSIWHPAHCRGVSRAQNCTCSS